MKPNLLFVQSADFDINPQIEKFCEYFCDTHYVYLVRTGSEFRDDSPAGLRFLNHRLDRLPSFAELDTVVSVADPRIADLLRTAYPESKLAIWDPEDEWHIPDVLVSLLRPTIVQGDFNSPKKAEFAHAM